MSLICSILYYYYPTKFSYFQVMTKPRSQGQLLSVMLKIVLLTYTVTSLTSTSAIDMIRLNACAQPNKMSQNKQMVSNTPSI